MNPGDEERVEEARRFREEFHWGNKARGMSRVRVPGAPRVLVKLGTLAEIAYSTNKRGDGPSTYVHSFGEGGGRRPSLAMDVDSGRLHIVGGTYRVKREGIVG